MLEASDREVLKNIIISIFRIFRLKHGVFWRFSLHCAHRADWRVGKKGAVSCTLIGWVHFSFRRFSGTLIRRVSASHRLGRKIPFGLWPEASPVSGPDSQLGVSICHISFLSICEMVLWFFVSALFLLFWLWKVRLR